MSQRDGGSSNHITASNTTVAGPLGSATGGDQTITSTNIGNIGNNNRILNGNTVTVGGIPVLGGTGTGTGTGLPGTGGPVVTLAQGASVADFRASVRDAVDQAHAQADAARAYAAAVRDLFHSGTPGSLPTLPGTGTGTGTTIPTLPTFPDLGDLFGGLDFPIDIGNLPGTGTGLPGGGLPGGGLPGGGLPGGGLPGSGSVDLQGLLTSVFNFVGIEGTGQTPGAGDALFLDVGGLLDSVNGFLGITDAGTGAV